MCSCHRCKLKPKSGSGLVRTASRSAAELEPQYEFLTFPLVPGPVPASLSWKPQANGDSPSSRQSGPVLCVHREAVFSAFAPSTPPRSRSRCGGWCPAAWPQPPAPPASGLLSWTQSSGRKVSPRDARPYAHGSFCLCGPCLWVGAGPGSAINDTVFQGLSSWTLSAPAGKLQV